MKITEAKTVCSEIAEKYPEYADAMKTMENSINILLSFNEAIDSYPLAENRKVWGAHGGLQLAKEIMRDKIQKVETA